jgi:diphthamide biosynthesis protein 7
VIVFVFLSFCYLFRWHPNDPSLLLLACMRGGFRVVSFLDKELTELVHYTKHDSESLAYGVDWIVSNNRIACCSFYDHNCSMFHWSKK